MPFTIRRKPSQLSGDDKRNSENSPQPFLPRVDALLQLRRDAYGTWAEVAVFLAFLLAFTSVSFGSKVSQEQEFNQALLEQFSMPHFQNTESIDSWLMRSLSLLFPRDAIAPGFFHDDKLQLIGHMQQRQLSMPAVECAAVGVYSAAAQWCYKSFSAE